MLLTTFLLLFASPLSPASPSPPAPPRGLLLVLPPEAAAGTAETWVGEAVADQLPRSLAEIGVPAISRAERLQAQASLEIPDVPLSRATSVRVAEALGATRLVTGTYAVEGSRVTLSLRLLDVERATLSAPVIAGGPLEGAMGLIDGLAWDVALAGPFPPRRTREQFMAGRPSVPIEAFRTYARALASRDQHAQDALLRRVVAAVPAFDAARVALGRLLLDEREFPAANQTLARVKAGSPLVREARFLQGVALLEMGRYHQAAGVYAALAETEPTPGVLNNEALAVLRDPVPGSRRASEVMRQALARDPESVDLAFNLAWCLLAEDDPAGAAFNLQNLTKVAPLDRHTRVVLAWALRRANRTVEADQQWQGVVALAPSYASLVTPDLSRRFERIQRSERPFELSRESRSDAQIAASLYLKAQRLADGGDASSALAEATRAGYLDPYNRSIHVLLARLHHAKGDGEKALNEYRMALWSEDDAAIRVEVARMLKEMGRAAEARAEAARALALAPDNEAARKLAEMPR